ncbi:MAG: UbiD family decarboxylase [Planctomycetota bacterium]
MYPDLQSFVRALDDAGELVRITDEIDPVLEIGHLADLASKSRCPGEPSGSAKSNDPVYWDRGGPAILCENVKGSKFPVLINAYGSYRRMEMALGAFGRHDTRSYQDGATSNVEVTVRKGAKYEFGGFDGIGAVIGELVKPQPPRGLGEAIAKAKQFAPLLKIGPKRKKSAVSQEVVVTGDAIDLTTLPIIRCWQHDGDYAALGYPEGVNERVPDLGHPGIDAERWEREFRGRYITLSGIHTIHADDIGEDKPSSHNIGMYRVQLLGKQRLAMHWHMHHDGASHWRSWKKRGEDMPVAIALGGESVLPYAATAPLPPGISELLMGGFLNQGGIKLVKGKTVPLWVPANAEMIIEGYVSHEAGFIGWDPRETDEPLGPGAVFEGPFGDHTGFYSMPDRYPVLKVTAVTHRRDAIYPTTVVGLPPQEDYFLGKATERLFLPLLKVLIPDIADYDLPMFGAFHNCAFVQIQKHYPLQGRRVMHAIWGAGQMAWTKSIFVVDDQTDVHDQRAVLEAASRWCDPRRDVELVNGPLDILDHAAPRLAAGGKIGFDCTRPWAGEEVNGIAVSKAPRVLPEGNDLVELLEAVTTVDGVRDAAIPEAAPGWLIVETARGYDEPDGAGLGRRVLGQILDRLRGKPDERVAPFIVAVGRGVDCRDAIDGLFHWLANMDPTRDLITPAESGVNCLAFDATPKTRSQEGERGDEANGQPVRAWPPVLELDQAVLGHAKSLLGLREQSASSVAPG